MLAAAMKITLRKIATNCTGVSQSRPVTSESQPIQRGNPPSFNTAKPAPIPNTANPSAIPNHVSAWSTESAWVTCFPR